MYVCMYINQKRRSCLFRQEQSRLSPKTWQDNRSDAAIPFSFGKQNWIYLAGVTVDEDDAVYVLWKDKTLSVYRVDGENIHRWGLLKFLENFGGVLQAITVTKDKSIVIIWTDYLEYETNIMVYLCNKDGELTNSFDTGLKNKDNGVKSFSASCDGEIKIVTIKIYDPSFMFHTWTYSLWTYSFSAENSTALVEFNFCYRRIERSLWVNDQIECVKQSNLNKRIQLNYFLKEIPRIG